MPDAQIEKMQTQIKELQAAVRPGQTPALIITMMLGLLAYAGWMLAGELPGQPGMGWRIGVGVAVAFATAIIYALSLGFVEVAFKVLVEVSAALLLIGTAGAGVLACLLAPAHTAQLVQAFPKLDPQAAAVVVYAASALALLLTNVGAMLALYPLAKTAGTSLEPD